MVCLKVFSFSEEGKDLMKKYEVSPPSLLYFEPCSRNLLFIKQKKISVDDLLENGNQAINIVNNNSNYCRIPKISEISIESYKFESVYKDGAYTASFLQDYALFLKKNNLADFEVIADEYVSKLGSLLLNKKENALFVLNSCTKMESKCFEFILDNKEFFSYEFGFKKVEEVLQNAILFSVKSNTDNSVLYDAKNNIDKIDFKLINEDDFLILLKGAYYEKNEGLDGFYIEAKEYLEKTKYNNVFVLNELAKKFALYDDNEYLRFALDCSEKAVALHPDDYTLLETQAAILYKQQKSKQAMKIVKNAVLKAREKGEKYYSVLRLMDAIDKRKRIDRIETNF